MTFAILLLALIVATCFIAYFADNLGKHLGKKRISLKMGRFSLRPRQTATLISMVSSVAIMLFTLGFLLTVNKSIRNALLGYDAAKKAANIERRKNEQLLRDFNSQRVKFEKQSQTLSRSIETNQKLANTVVAQRQKAEAQLRAANTRLSGVRVLLSSAQRARAAASRGVAAAKAGERAAIARGQSARRQYAQAQSRFQSVQSQLGAAQSQFREAQNRLRDEKQRVNKANQGLKKVNQSLGATRDQLHQARQNLQFAKARQLDASTRLVQAQTLLKTTERNFANVKSQVEATLAQYNSATEDIEELKVLRTRLQQELEQKTQIINQIAANDIAIRIGEVFAEKTILPGTSAPQARKILQELMAAGRAKLNAPQKTLSLVWPKSIVANSNDSPLTEEEFLNGFAADLSTLNVAASIRLLAVRDHARGETEVFARLTPVVVRTIFQRDSILASTNIEAASSDARVFNQLLTLLNESEKRARSRGVTPLITGENEYFYAGGTNERIFEALRLIQAAEGTVRVNLRAAEDVTSVESVSVRFEIVQQ